MRTTTIKEIVWRLVQISFLAGLQSAWLFCAADLFFSYVFGSEIDARNIIPIYFVAVLINVTAISTLRLFLWRAIINLLAIILIFALLPPFSLSIPFITSGKTLVNGGSAIFLGLAIIMTAVIFWFQGFRLAAAETGFQYSLREFQFGIFIFLLVFFSQAMSGLDKSYFTPAIIFFVCGMISLFLSRRERPASATGFSIMINVTAFVCIILTVICGLLLAALFNPDLADLLYWAGKSVLDFIINLIRQIMSFLADIIPKPPTGALPPEPIAPPPVEPPAISVLLKVPEAFRNWGGRIVMGFVVIMLLAALWRVAQQMLENLRRRKNVIRTDVSNLQSSYLKKILAWIKNAAAALMKKLLWLYRRRQRQNNDSLTMKFIYGQILSWAAMDGYPQKVSHTPHELFPQLTIWLPEAAGELNFITNQFVKVRYGEYKLNKDTLQQAWESYKKIKQRKRRLFFRRRRK